MFAKKDHTTTETHHVFVCFSYYHRKVATFAHLTKIPKTQEFLLSSSKLKNIMKKEETKNLEKQQEELTIENENELEEVEAPKSKNRFMLILGLVLSVFVIVGAAYMMKGKKVEKPKVVKVSKNFGSYTMNTFGKLNNTNPWIGGLITVGAIGAIVAVTKYLL